MRELRQIIKNGEYNPDDGSGADTMKLSLYRPKYLTNQRSDKGFDKAIVAIRLALSHLAGVIEENEKGDWIIYETLMHHKSMLHSQLDLLLRQKKNISNLTASIRL
jgi:hypothetical protein